MDLQKRPQDEIGRKWNSKLQMQELEFWESSQPIHLGWFLFAIEA
jgi:hypothetical protein